jgi:hypothetical protein
MIETVMLSFLLMAVRPAKLDFQFSPFSALMRDGFERVHELIGSEEFTFVVNGESFVVRLSDAIVLSSEVFQSLESDAGFRLFGVTTTEATAADFGRFLTFSRSPLISNLPLESGLPFCRFAACSGMMRCRLFCLR